jgi:hypothetical protein
MSEQCEPLSPKRLFQQTVADLIDESGKTQVRARPPNGKRFPAAPRRARQAKATESRFRPWLLQGGVDQ